MVFIITNILLFIYKIIEEIEEFEELEYPVFEVYQNNNIEDDED